MEGTKTVLILPKQGNMRREVREVAKLHQAFV